MKNRTRALVSSLLTLAMIIGFMPGASIKASAAGADNWYKDANISWYNKDWSSFTIDTAEDLAGLAKLVNEETDDFKGDTITLDADIDLTGHEWTPIGWYNFKDSYIYPFDGTFDGGGHKIEGVNISTDAIKECGLFGCLWTSACIKNLNVENVNIASSYYVEDIANPGIADAGGIVGYSYGGTVENCLATGTVTVTGAQA
ncbi:MAG: GLUG motif-containing protein, partial [Bacillota bacterium]|nr:GLUG motif-containing protein [Bacillota bacterium]